MSICEERCEKGFRRNLTLTNDVQEVPRLVEHVDAACEAVGFDMSTTMQINLAIEEAVVNVIDYAYPVGTKGDICIEFVAGEEGLVVTISDSGAPFDPTTRGEVDTTLSAEERSIGGLGIMLMRRYMDSTEYRREGDRNILTLTKRRTN
jgi:sigma-B regulation protein RsbU (phosphoserine phosphatase)